MLPHQFEWKAKLPGYYVDAECSECVIPHHRPTHYTARRLLDADGRLPAGQLLIRPLVGNDDWQSTGENISAKDPLNAINQINDYSRVSAEYLGSLTGASVRQVNSGV